MSSKQAEIHWLSVGQFAYSGLALLGLLGLALVVGLSALSTMMRTPGTELSILFQAAALLLAAILVLPSLAISFLRLMGWLPSPQFETHLLPGKWWWATLVAIALVWVLAWLLSTRGIQLTGISSLMLPPLYLLVGALPVVFWFVLGAHGLPGGSPQRRWGLLTATLTGSTLLIIVFEIIALIGVVITAALVIASRPEWATEFTRLARQITNSPLDPERLSRIFTPYLSRPWVIITGLAVACGLIPLIEEFFKPLAVWVLVGRRPSPAEGFVAGLVCGAGFALFESLGMLASASGETWQAVAAGRAGTDLLHITTSGWLGWALACTWQDRKYGRLLLMYLAAVATHGLWNLASLGSSILPDLPRSSSPVVRWMQQPGVASAGLWLVGIMLVASLIVLGRRLRSRHAASLVESNQPPDGVMS